MIKVISIARNRSKVEAEQHLAKEDSFQQMLSKLSEENKELKSQNKRLKCYLKAEKKTVNEQKSEKECQVTRIAELQKRVKDLEEKKQTNENIPTYIKNFEKKPFTRAPKRKVVEYDSAYMQTGKNSCHISIFFKDYNLNSIVKLVFSSSEVISAKKNKEITHTVTTTATTTANTTKNIQITVPGFQNMDEKIQSYLEDQAIRHYKHQQQKE